MLSPRCHHSMWLNEERRRGREVPEEWGKGQRNGSEKILSVAIPPSNCGQIRDVCGLSEKRHSCGG